MSRPTRLIIDTYALTHNLMQIKRLAPHQKIIAMIKANAYGCGVGVVAPVLDGQVDAFGVACLEEALIIKALGCNTPCILFQGIFSPDELPIVAEQQFDCVIHQPYQLEWLLNTPLPKPISIWVKADTGMGRLGFKIKEIPGVIAALKQCSWVDKGIGLMTHLACSDEPEKPENQQQITLFQQINLPGVARRSIANSAAIISLPESHADVVRPGIMLYGVSPFANQTADELGLIPVMRFVSAISAIYNNPPFSKVGYGGTWHSENPSVIGIVAAGYGDGYPRHIKPNTPVWINNAEVPIVGRVSMDMLAVDLTNHPLVRIGDQVELWGQHILVERIANN